MFWLILIGVLILVIVFWRIFKIPKCGNMVLITGGIKTGKSTLSVRMAYKTLKKQRLRVRIYNLFVIFFHKFWKRFSEKKPLPLLYSNVPLSIPYVPITQALLERRERFVYGSVVYMCEASLIADSMSFKDVYTNEQLLLFVKLFAHETKGGYVFYDTQSVYDNHYAIKRCLSSYLDIHHNIKIPFFILMFVRELKFSEDHTTVNSYSEDVEETLKIVVVPKRTWKYFDRFCYSVLTDHLPVNAKLVDPDLQEDLKARDIITFKDDTKDFMYGGVTRSEIEQLQERRRVEKEKRINQLRRGSRQSFTTRKRG